MMPDKKKIATIKLDNVFNEQDIREISNAIVRAIRVSSKEKISEILQALKK